MLAKAEKNYIFLEKKKNLFLIIYYPRTENLFFMMNHILGQSSSPGHLCHLCILIE